MIPLITYIQTRISQLILLKFYKAQEGRRTNKPKKKHKSPSSQNLTVPCHLFTRLSPSCIHSVEDMFVCTSWLVRRCLDRCFAFNFDVVYAPTVSWEFIIAQENSATAAECRAKEFGCIHNPWFRPRRSGSLFSKVRIPALNCPLSRPLSIEVDQDVNLLEDFSSHSS